MVLDGEGGIVMLDRDEKTVRVFDETGKLLRMLPRAAPGTSCRSPVDVAVDPFRNLYVADQEGAVLVLSPRASCWRRWPRADDAQARRPDPGPDRRGPGLRRAAERILRFR